MLCAPVFIFTSGSSALLGRPRCGLSILESLYPLKPRGASYPASFVFAFFVFPLFFCLSFVLSFSKFVVSFCYIFMCVCVCVCVCV